MWFRPACWPSSNKLFVHAGGRSVLTRALMTGGLPPRPTFPIRKWVPLPSCPSVAKRDTSHKKGGQPGGELTHKSTVGSVRLFVHTGGLSVLTSALMTGQPSRVPGRCGGIKMSIEVVWPDEWSIAHCANADVSYDAGLASRPARSTFQASLVSLSARLPWSTATMALPSPLRLIDTAILLPSALLARQ